MKASEIPAVTIAPADGFNRLPPTLGGFDEFDRALRLNCPVYALASTHAEAMGLSPADAARWAVYQLALHVAGLAELNEQLIRRTPTTLVSSFRAGYAAPAILRAAAEDPDRLGGITGLAIVTELNGRPIEITGDIDHGGEVRRE